MTQPLQLPELFAQHKAKSLLLRNESVRERIKKLIKLREWVLKNRDKIIEAVRKDLGKPPLEIDSNEIYTTVSAINHIIKNVKRWTKHKK
ncbi:MAG: hypothetical protein HC811_05540 [Flammeovirgaceae bacterium]|nr:hypothetical protein [Flammeovirgaceae bacterium]